MERKLTVVWLCHFNNDEVHRALCLNSKSIEHAPWITIALKTVENNPYFDLYVVAPRYDIEEEKQIEIRGIHYIFYNPHLKWNYRLLHNRFLDIDYVSNFKTHKILVKDIVKKINPDIIHLIGAENPDYSATILPLMNSYPTILTVQGFCSHSKEKLKGYQKRRAYIEDEIIKKMRIAFYETKKQGADIKGYNPEIELMYHTYGSYKIENPPLCNDKKYDMVFFARICRDKGIIDFLDITKQIKEVKQNVSVCVIGSGKIKEFQDYAKNIGVEKNIYWAGFQPNRDDVYKLAIKGKICVLPTYHDVIPGTIIESMFLGIPVVSYATDSIPEINEKGEVIKLVPTGDVAAMANEVYNLLSDNLLSQKLSEQAYKRALDLFDPSKEYLQKCLFKGYKRGIELFHLK